MSLSQELAWRGFVNQTTYKSTSAIDKSPITFYLGIDPSASSMTIGNLAVMMLVRHFVSQGHKAVLLVGGATGLIGDPDGKAQERELISLEELERNKRAIAGQFKQLLADQPFELVDNYDWFKDMRFLDFLRDIGKHVPVRTMLGRDFVQARLGAEGAGISYAEFSYSLMQAYDFLHLHREHGVSLQLCGADQWGNSVAGVDLIRRVTGDDVNVFSAPLVVNASTGAKFGKTEAGAVWLDPQLTRPYDFYQFWLNVDDEGVENYLKIYTLLNQDEIEHVMAEFNLSRAGRAAQRALAHEVTKLVHGEQVLSDVLEVTQLLFSGLPLEDSAYAKIKNVFETVPLAGDAPLLEAIVSLGLASSNTEARRFVAEGAVQLNNDRASIDKRNLSQADFHDGILVARRGKNALAVGRLI